MNLLEMPVITNFGDVVTTGNATVQGTGTSSFAGPVTFAQTVTVTGALSSITGFYGVVAGNNTAAVSVLTASSNVNAPTMNATVSNAVTLVSAGIYGPVAGDNTAAVSVLTASTNVNAPTINVASLNVSSQANVTSLNVSGLSVLTTANILAGFANLTSANISTINVPSLNVSGTAFLSNANVLTANLTSANVTTANVSSLNVSGTAFLSNANVLTANLTSANVTTGNVSSLNVSGTAFLSNANVLTGNLTTANISSLNVTGDANIANLTVRSNLYTSNIIMSSNLSTNTGYGNVYLTGNLVVQGNIFSIGGSVGSGSGTSQGVLYSLGSSYTLGSSFATGTAGPSIAGYHVNLNSFTAEAVASVTAFGATTGMLKFTTAGLYQLTCVIVGDQPVAKVAIGKTSSSTFPPSVTATSGYDYVYNYPVGSSPSELVTIPISVTDTSPYYYLDVFFSTAAGTPTVLYPTRSTTAAGSAYGTYVQVAPFGNYLSSATGVASALLANCAGSSNLSGVYSSNAYRVTLTSANGWTVNGTSTSLAVTSNGNFQVNQAGIYEVNLCLNTVGNTPVQFQIGSLATDALVPGGSTPYYLYSYAPMYTQDPTTVIQLPMNITNISNVYFVECSFAGTVTGNVSLNSTSTFVSIKPIGGFINTGTNPWIQQGTSVYYPSGPVGIGGVDPAALTDTLTVNGTSAFVGNVTVTSDASSNTYISAKRTPAGSLDVTQYVTGSVPLTTTTNLIKNYLSNAATITSNTGTGSITQALNLPGTVSSGVRWPSGGHSVALANLALSNLFIEAWVNGSLFSGSDRHILNRAGDFKLYITSGGTLEAQVERTSGAGVTASNSTVLSLGTWYHVAASYQRTGLTAGTLRVFVNGVLGTTNGVLASFQPRFTVGASTTIGTNESGSAQLFTGNIADVRVFSGSLIVPTATFTTNTAPFSLTAPNYATNMGLVGTANTVLALQTQYFPGASTSPYGPVLTLPGTVGSYYTQTGTFLNTSLNSGFTIEAWVNYASLANSNISANGPAPFTVGKFNPVASGTGGDWFFGVAQTGQVALNFFNGASNYSINTAGIITTGSWNHLVAQGNTAGFVNMYINGVQQALQAGGYAGSGTSVAFNGTVSTGQYNGITVGQYYGNQCPNFAIAKARVLFGANTYTTSTFTPSPNLGAVPAGATVAWQLESQYPLPTYPSFFDVPVLSLQTPSYGAEPVVVGGVSSNVLSPYSSNSQFDSIRFDGTGYIDYGNAASSALTSNIWASPWTIEGWVYPTAFPGGQNFILGRGNDFMLYITTTQIGFASNIGSATNYNAGASSFAAGSWSHVAVTFDGTRSNVYVGGALSNTIPVSAMSLPFTPTTSFQVGIAYNTQFQGNLADLRVSNVARYSGTTYVVPSAPFTNDSSTMLLLRSLAGQIGTTLEVQGRGLNTVSLGSTQTVRAYPPAPMSSYLLDTTGNVSVTYGQGKYVASASSEYASGANNLNVAWNAFDKNLTFSSTNQWSCTNGFYGSGTPATYTSSVTTIDTLGNSYSGEWIQIQIPVSVLLSTYTLIGNNNANNNPYKFWILGSRDGTNWSLVDSRTGVTWASPWSQTFTVSTTQAYIFYRCIVNQIQNAGGGAGVNPVITEWILNGTEESLCITNDAKVGIGIANPQRSLEVAGDLVVGGTISGGAGMGQFRNRIINGDMRIAQRGVGPSTIGTAGYLTMDRWAQYASSGTVTVAQRLLTASDTPWQLGFSNSYLITVLSSPTVSADSSPMSQSIEGYNIADLKWGTSFGQPVTLSFWIRSNLPQGSVLHASVKSGGSYSYLVAVTTVGLGTWQYATFTIPPPPNGSSWPTTNTTGMLLNFFYFNASGTYTAQPFTWLAGNYVTANNSTNWTQTAGNYIEITGVQLEKGTVATPFEFRPYATELALCQRYFYQITSTNQNYQQIGTGWTSGTTAYITVPHQVTMRTAPTAISNSAPNTFGVTSAAFNATATGIALQYGGQTASAVSVTVSGQTAGQGAILQFNNTSSGFIGFSAEL